MTPLKLKIKLENTPYPISRKLLVPEDIDMLQLHLVIQIAMGWDNYHLWQFSDAKWKGRIRVMLPMDDDFGFDDEECRDAYEVSLKSTFLKENGGKPFWYWYDFGDEWWHKISFLKTQKKDQELFDGTPVCIEAVGGCPPEDCGGPWGYGAFLEAISNPRHGEYAQMREWAGLEEEGDTWPTEAPAVELINKEIKVLYKSPSWKSEEWDFENLFPYKDPL